MSDTRTRGERAKWHVNQALRLACEAMAEQLNTGPDELMDAERLHAFDRTWETMQVLAPLVRST